MILHLPASRIQKGICKSRTIFWASLMFKIGRGNRISFQRDRWCIDMLLKYLFPQWHTIAPNKHTLINDHWHRDGWRLPGVICRNAHERTSKRKIQVVLDQNNPPKNQDDTARWMWETDELFTVISVYRICNDCWCRMKNTGLIRRANFPPRVRVFLWLLAKNAYTYRTTSIGRAEQVLAYAHYAGRTPKLQHT